MLNLLLLSLPMRAVPTNARTQKHGVLSAIRAMLSTSIYNFFFIESTSIYLQQTTSLSLYTYCWKMRRVFSTPTSIYSWRCVQSVRQSDSDPALFGRRINGEQKIEVLRFQKWWLLGETKRGAPPTNIADPDSGGGELGHFPASDCDEAMRCCRSEYGELDGGNGEPRSCSNFYE